MAPSRPYKAVSAQFTINSPQFNHHFDSTPLRLNHLSPLTLILIAFPPQNMPAPTTPPSSSLPSPQTFDFLPPLSPLLSRLLLAPHPANSSSLATSPAGGSPPTTNNDTTDAPLSPKDLPAAVQQIYARIGKARQVVRGMDGVAMSVEEQEGMVRELEGEVERGRGVLEGLGGRAAAAAG